MSEIKDMGKMELGDKGGIAGFALGYAQMYWEKDKQEINNTHGMHMDFSLAHLKIALPLVWPAIKIHANMTFPNVAGTLGVGPSVHFGLPGVIQGYGGLMVNGHAASMNDGGEIGWSANAVAGGQLLILYGEGNFPIAGSSFRQTYGFTTGIRFGF